MAELDFVNVAAYQYSNVPASQFCSNFRNSDFLYVNNTKSVQGNVSRIKQTFGKLKPKNLLFSGPKSILKMSRHHNFLVFDFFQQLPIQSSKNGFGIISLSVIKHLENSFERHLVNLVADMRGKMYKAKT